jgi:hypothetical protein
MLAARRPFSSWARPAPVTDLAARAMQTAEAPWVALAGGNRLTANPAALSKKRAKGTLYLRGDRPVLEARAEGPRVPAARSSTSRT